MVTVSHTQEMITTIALPKSLLRLGHCAGSSPDADGFVTMEADSGDAGFTMPSSKKRSKSVAYAADPTQQHSFVKLGPTQAAGLFQWPERYFDDVRSGVDGDVLFGRVLEWFQGGIAACLY
jgi:hypothetical protein